jgi:hypothetical protein
MTSTRTTLGILIATTLFITSCTKTLDKSLNKEDFNEVKQTINSDESKSAMKKKYVIDNLSTIIELAELGKAMEMEKSLIPTFREQISDLSNDFDSIRIAKNKIRENNKKLKEFISLIDVNTVCIDKYKGYLSMTLDFNNQFEKEILYIVLNYKYVNKYDSEFFNEKTKLTDEVAGEFKGELKVSTTETYNDVAEFMYTKVPEQASKALRDELGVEEANKKVKHEFLMEGMKIETLAIIFKDKTELIREEADWEYLED